MARMNKPSTEMRQHILEVARALMTAKGYTAVGLAEVLSNAGVPKGSFYYYFKSKEEFGAALLEEYFGEYLARVTPILEGQAKASDCLAAYFAHWIETQGADIPQQKCLVVKLGPEVCDLSEAMRLVLDRGTVRIVSLIARCIERGIEDKSIQTACDSSMLAQALYQLWLGASLQAKLQMSTKAFDAAVQATQTLVR
ncbi:Regulatory protein, TetR [Pseudomonas syringae pv. aceris]|uniref:Regulatory protein, TetR n=2 Tax=Pseudomonas amygdali TaxID=47877 RepID=A0AAX1VPM6_PSEAJ|nr:Regulatory protein [Pseudomonas syringae pv. syringae]KPX61307.1 Regulatory protein, TetR [Pseudomonas amygdali pv. lachrymans]KPY79823.1 Regulatory protein, TetR [Pseudomonas amygdali pv. tabaci]RMS22712.1 Regulatory protein, TetR [Pseudomonas syringae pv. aceris]RML77294.1 Regulatory protein, TetR [Pseudomonas amygdali pv. tabaci]